jgi:hypothetical protein
MTNLDEDFASKAGTAAQAHYLEFREELEKLQAFKRKLAPVVNGVPSACKCREDGDTSRCPLHKPAEPVVLYAAELELPKADDAQLELTLFEQPKIEVSEPKVPKPSKGSSKK